MPLQWYGRAFQFVAILYQQTKTKFQTMREKNYRSIVKAISYRITGTITTFLISLFVTGEIEFAVSIMSADIVIKIFIFYFHERLWNKIKFGKTPTLEPDYQI